MGFTNLKNFLDHMAAERSSGNVVEVYKDVFLLQDHHRYGGYAAAGSESG